MNLDRLLRLLASNPAETTKLLREDLRSERNKANGVKSGGGHFHAPFWSDAKAHVIGIFDLNQQTLLRIEALEQRRRLYPLLSNGFLKWFNDLKRSTNQKVGWEEANAHNRFGYPGLDLIIKVEGLLGLQIGHDRHLLVYPYFAEQPTLNETWARVGLWLMASALADFDISEMHILDIIRGRSFANPSIFLKGDEDRIFFDRYSQLLNEWRALRPHYGLA